MTWAERAAERSPVVQRSRSRSVEQAKAIVAAARRLLTERGPSFTTQELVKEAGIALQTFYRYFAGKDQLMLAVIEDLISENCARYRREAAGIADPVERLHHHITAVLRGLEAKGKVSFIPIEHWRLEALYPDEVSRVTGLYAELLLEEIEAGIEAGLLAPADPEHAAWLINQLVVAVFHHYSFITVEEPLQARTEKLWDFCLAALGGKAKAPERPDKKG